MKKSNNEAIVLKNIIREKILVQLFSTEVSDSFINIKIEILMQ